MPERPRSPRPGLLRGEDRLDDPQAYPALRALLRRDDLDEAGTARAVDLTLAWIDRHADTGGVRALLETLLTRYDIDDERVARVVEATLAWLDRRGAEEESDFVLRALLERGDLDGEPAARAARAALAWLDLHGATPEAQFTLRALLRREELGGEDARRAVKAALAWLELHRDLPEASFVLPLLLGRTGLKKGEGPRTVAAAVAWLSKHAAEPEASYVVSALVRSRHVTMEHQHRAGELSLAWFRQAPPGRDGRRYQVLLGLLRHAPRFDDSIVRAAVDEAVRGLPTAAVPRELYTSLLFDLSHVARRVERVAEVRALAESAPPGMEVPRASRSEFRRLCDELVVRARDRSAPVDVAWLSRALAETARQVDQHAASTAVFALPGLLPLAARSGSEALLAGAVKVAADAVRTAMVEEHELRRELPATLRACHELLDVWPDRAVGERLLARVAPGAMSGG